MLVEESKSVDGQKKNEKVNYDTIVNQQVDLKLWTTLLNDPNSKISQLWSGAVTAFQKWQKSMLKALEVLSQKKEEISIK